MRIVVGVLVSVVLAAVAVLALGPAPALLPALAIAAVAPPLTRVDLAEHRLPNRLGVAAPGARRADRLVVPALAAGLVGFGLSWLVSGLTLIPVLAAGVYAGLLFVLALFG